jgi:3-hydroxymyristoyl/3-hydroxydecanoyl-(acyl carrier protein) dehydratase
VMPEVLGERREGARACYRLRVAASLQHFSDHFPRYPILPGVVQLDWAVRFARRSFAGLEQSYAFDNFKCRAPIGPDTELELVLQHNAKRRSVSFEYTERARGVVCSGTVLFAPPP